MGQKWRAEHFQIFPSFHYTASKLIPSFGVRAALRSLWDLLTLGSDKLSRFCIKMAFVLLIAGVFTILLEPNYYYENTREFISDSQFPNYVLATYIYAVFNRFWHRKIFKQSTKLLLTLILFSMVFLLKYIECWNCWRYSLYLGALLIIPAVNWRQ